MSSENRLKPRTLIGYGLIVATVFGIGKFAFDSFQTRQQLSLVSSKDAASQAEGVKLLMGRGVLFDALQGGAPTETRLAAVATLKSLAEGGKDPAAFNQLLQMLKDPDTESTEKKTHPVRDAAKDAVAAMGISYAETLLDAAKDPDGNIRDQSRNALKAIGAPLKEQMAKRLADGSLRGPMGEVLAGIGPETISLIAPYLSDEKIKTDSGAKISLIETLGKFKTPEAAQPLLAFKDDPDPNVRRAVITSLANIGDPVGAPVLIAALKSRDTDASARAAAAGALGNIATPEANAAMLAAISDYDTFVAAAAAAGLRRAGDVGAAQIAQALGSPDVAVRTRAAEATGGLRTTALAIKATADPETSVKIAALTSLGDILSRAAGIRKALATLAGAQDAKAQETAYNDLKRLGGEQEVTAPGAPARAKTQLIALFNSQKAAAKDDKARADLDKQIAALNAASKLSPLASPTEFAPLLAALSDPGDGVAPAASAALARLGADVVPALAAKLAGEDTVAYFASTALTTIGRAAVSKLLPLAVVGNPAARWTAITLGQIGDVQAASVLEALAKSPDTDIAYAAQTALARVKPS